MKRKKDFRQGQKYMQRHRGRKVASSWSQKGSKAVLGGSGVPSNVINRMLFRAMKERKKETPMSP